MDVKEYHEQVCQTEDKKLKDAFCQHESTRFADACLQASAVTADSSTAPEFGLMFD